MAFIIADSFPPRAPGFSAPPSSGCFQLQPGYNGRPHCAFSGITPNQAYHGQRFDKAVYRAAIMDAQAVRRGLNRRSCPPCVPFKREDEGERP